MKGIGGEHYKLEKEEWNFLLDSFGFSGIPTYLIFDKNGVMRYKITSYPGNAEMKAIIEKL
jgi:thioredoxin-related protein